MFVLVSYDITENKRRNKIHEILKSYGQWVQYSIFECDLTETQYAKLRHRLSKLIQGDMIVFVFTSFVSVVKVKLNVLVEKCPEIILFLSFEIFALRGSCTNE
nr:CRISPR-associated endonuclease Cas2 [Cyanothece sp. BG0011]